VPSKSILIVDKDAITRKYLKHTLEEKGYTTYQASSGKEGLIIAWRDHPEVIIADPILPDLDGDVFAKKIRQDRRTETTRLIALSSIQRKEFAEACLAQGYHHFLSKSGEAIIQLLALIEQGEQTKDEAKPKARAGSGKIFAFLSAKGGTGTSSLCANLAANINETEADAKVVVLDLVLPIGSISSLVGYQDNFSLKTITDLPVEEITPTMLDKELPTLSLWHFQLLASPSNPEESNALQIQNIPHVVDTLRGTFDYIFVDLGRSLSKISLPIIKEAELTVLILSTDKSTVSITKTVADYLKKQGIKEENLYPILNRAVGLEGLTKAEAEKELGLEIKTTIPYMGGNFTLANNQSQPLKYKFPSDMTSIILQRLTNRLIGAQEDEAS